MSSWLDFKAFTDKLMFVLLSYTSCFHELIIYYRQQICHDFSFSDVTESTQGMNSTLKEMMKEI